MITNDEKIITKLVEDALNNTGTELIYSMAGKYAAIIDHDVNTDIPKEIAMKMNYAVYGFAAGIDFALRNLEITDDEQE